MTKEKSKYINLLYVLSSWYMWLKFLWNYYLLQILKLPTAESFGPPPKTYAAYAIDHWKVFIKSRMYNYFINYWYISLFRGNMQYKKMLSYLNWTILIKLILLPSLKYPFRIKDLTSSLIVKHLSIKLSITITYQYINQYMN